MNENTQNAPKPDKAPMSPKAKKGLAIGGAVVAGLFMFTLGMGAGAGATPPGASPVAVVSPEPAPTVTVTPEPVEKVVEKIVEVEVPGDTVTVETAPQSCTTALNLADEGFGYAAEAMGEISSALDYVMGGDYSGATAAMDRLDIVTEKIGGITGPYNTAKESCKSS